MGEQSVIGMWIYSYGCIPDKFPVSQTANIKAGESSHINSLELILINSFSHGDAHGSGSYAQAVAPYPQNWFFSRSFHPLVHTFCQEK